MTKYLHWNSWRVYIFQLYDLLLWEFWQSSRSRNDDMGCFFLVLQLPLVVFNGLSTVVTSETDFRRFKVSSQSLKVFENLMSKLSSVTSDYCLVLLELTIFGGSHLIENWNNKNCSFAHARLGLAQNVVARQGVGNGVDLNFARMLKPALSYSSLQLVLEEKLIPTNKVGTKLALCRSFVRYDLFVVLVAVFIVRNFHVLHLNNLF